MLVLVIVIESLVMVVPTGLIFVWHHGSAKFPLCSMSTCFNFSRCNCKEQLLVYSYNDPAPLNPPTYFRGFPDSQLQTSDPEKACLFFVYSDTESNENAWWWQKPHLQTLPFWNNGMNHVIITFADRWSKTNPPAESIGMASIMSTELHHTAYRGGFDISIPLPRLQQQSPPELASVKPFQRKYFATFKGTRYLSREGAFRSSEAFRGMHNEKDVIVATTCRQETNDKLVRWQPWKATGCEEDQRVYDSYDFVDLLNSTFAFVPAGRSPASYRFLEVLSAGAIPVLIADDYVRPFESLIQWERCLLQFSTHDLHRILPTLRSLAKEDVVDRQCYCQRVFASFLQDDSTLVRSVILSLQQRMRS
jgi:glucuronyl/N-acetylglucosaminyl transferase EXT1